MDVVTALRLNMTNTDDPAAAHGPRYRAALELAEYADRYGFAAISCEEHHGSPTGWLPSPLLLASALAARTSRAALSISALLVPLYDPVRLAEDIAVLDNLSAGRLAIVAGIGYRPEEYAAAGRDFTRRGQLMDEALELMLAAWCGAELERGGARVRVTPRPFTTPHPTLLIGGMSKAAARRAARFDLPFSPPMSMPDLEQYYLDEAQRYGNTGYVHRPEPGSRITLLHNDPDRAWHEYGPHILTEAREYGSWRRPGVPRPHEYADAAIDRIRELGYAEILTPAELLAQIAAGRTEVIVNPLIGGLPIDAAWEIMHLLVEEVLARIDTPETHTSTADFDQPGDSVRHDRPIAAQ